MIFFERFSVVYIIFAATTLNASSSSPFICPLPYEPQLFLGFVCNPSIEEGRVQATETDYGHGLVVFLDLPENTTCSSSDLAGIWIDQQIWTGQHIRFRRIYYDLLEEEEEEEEGEEPWSSWEIAYKAGINQEPAILFPFTREIFLPPAFLAFSKVQPPPPLQSETLSEEGWRSLKEMSSRKVIAVGDLHGDYDQTIRVLRMAELIGQDSTDWAGGNRTIFVQTGDVLDRGPDTIKLYLLLDKLKKQAFLAGGDMHQLLGNHEIMNLSGDLRYVTSEDFTSFGGIEAREKAFTPAGLIGRLLFHLPLAVKVNDTLFTHGGIAPNFAHLSIKQLNEASREELPKMVQEPDPMKQMQGWPLLSDETSPVWFRGWAQVEESEVVCEYLDQLLAAYSVKRMIVGHTVQYDGTILNKCNAKFFVIDVGISSAYGGNAAAIEINNGEVFAIYPEVKIKLN